MLSFLFASSIVFAYMEDVETKPYDAYVSNENGASYFDDSTEENEILEYGTEVRVEYEDYFSDDGVIYASCFVEGKKDKHFDLKVTDLSVRGSEKVVVTDLTDSQMAIVISKEKKVSLKKGPAAIYQNTGVVIPSGSEITIYQYSYQDAWVYVDYQGNQGWISTIFNQILLFPQYSEIELLYDTLYTGYDDENEMRMLLKGTKIQNYYETKPGIQLFIQNDEGKYGVISSENAVVKEKGVIEITQQYCNIYKNIVLEDDGTQNNILFSNIALGTKLPYQYHNPFLDAYFVEYNGISGWVYEYGNRVIVEEKAGVKTENSDKKEQQLSSEQLKALEIRAIEENGSEIRDETGKKVYLYGLILVFVTVIVLLLVIKISMK